MSPPAASAKTVLLTGSTGVIGRAIALGLAERNCSLILAVRDQSKGEALCQDIRARCPHAPAPQLEQVDLGSVASVKRFITTVETKYSRLDVLINNAAVRACFLDIFCYSRA
jgi:NAD(P)-dependent dehydrogenase (short-subunit alcohol dehydrogenase family)